MTLNCFIEKHLGKHPQDIANLQPCIVYCGKVQSGVFREICLYFFFRLDLRSIYTVLKH